MNKWESCYNDSWSDIIVPEAFSHPAKFSRGLVRRIYQHAKEMGWVKPGDYVLDPFGGVALGGLEAMSNGLNWVGVELEQKFVDLGKQNIDLWNRQLKGWPNLGTARIVQGDSRNLRGVIEGVGLIVSSPPFQSSLDSKDEKFQKVVRPGRTNQKSDYGHTPGNLANMKEGSIDFVCSSPPWENQEPSHAQGTGFQPAHDGNRRFIDSEYGKSQGNIGNSTGDTFWSASKEIVQGCYDVLKPGGHAIWVCKDYVKAKKRVPFSDRWKSLCESIGFKMVCHHKAMLVKFHGGQMNINGDTEEISTERKSFFRRLAEKKGSPRIDEEDVICFEKK